MPDLLNSMNDEIRNTSSLSFFMITKFNLSELKNHRSEITRKRGRHLALAFFMKRDDVDEISCSLLSKDVPGYEIWT